MARTPSHVIASKETQAAVEQAQAQFFRARCALTRANDELSKAEAAFKKEAEKVRGVPIEDYPESYWFAMERRDNFLMKLFDADDDFEAACEELQATRDAQLAADHAAASVAERRYSQLVSASA